MKKYLILLKSEFRGDLIKIEEKLTSLDVVVNSSMSTFGIIYTSMTENTYNKIKSLEEIDTIREEMEINILS